jgi:hypothetical protein
MNWQCGVERREGVGVICMGNAVFFAHHGGDSMDRIECVSQR